MVLAVLAVLARGKMYFFFDRTSRDIPLHMLMHLPGSCLAVFVFVMLSISASRPLSPSGPFDQSQADLKYSQLLQRVPLAQRNERFVYIMAFIS